MSTWLGTAPTALASASQARRVAELEHQLADANAQLAAKEHAVHAAKCGRHAVAVGI